MLLKQEEFTLEREVVFESLWQFRCIRIAQERLNHQRVGFVQVLGEGLTISE